MNLMSPIPAGVIAMIVGFFSISMSVYVHLPDNFEAEAVSATFICGLDDVNGHYFQTELHVINVSDEAVSAEVMMEWTEGDEGVEGVDSILLDVASGTSRTLNCQDARILSLRNERLVRSTASVRSTGPVRHEVIHFVTG